MGDRGAQEVIAKPIKRRKKGAMIRCKYVEVRADNSFSICQFLCFTVTCLNFVNRNPAVFFLVFFFICKTRSSAALESRPFDNSTP